MNKKERRRAMIICSITFIICGCLLAGVAYLKTGGKIGIGNRGNGWYYLYDDKNFNYIEKTENFSPYKNIKIDVSEYDVSFVPSDKFYIEYGYDESYAQPTISCINDTLSISTPRNSAKHFSISYTGFNYSDSKYHNNYLTVYYPKSTTFHSVSLASSSGDTILDTINSDTITIHNSFGDITIGDITGSNITCTANNGDIVVEDTTMDSATFSTDYGKIKVGNVDGENLNITSQNGDIKLDDAKISKFTIDSSYGKIDLSNVVSDTRSTVNASSGAITIYDSALKNINIDSSYGDVTGHNISFTNPSLHLQSGDLKLQGKILNSTEISTSYGDITLEISDKQKNYNINSTVSYGDIHIDDKQFEEKAEIYQTNAQHTITADSQSGDIRILFQSK